MAIDRTAAKQLFDQSRMYIERFPGKTAEEIIRLSIEEEVFPNRSNEQFLLNSMDFIKTTVQLILDHPNTFDGILLRKIEEVYNDFESRVRTDREWGMQMAVGGIAMTLVDVLDKFGNNPEVWGMVEGKLVDGYKEENYSGEAIKQMKEIFAQLPGKSNQDAFAFIVEQMSAENSPQLYAELYRVQAEKAREPNGLKI